MSDKKPAADDDSPGRSSNSNPIEHILVVDDEPHIRQLCTNALIYSGYHVETAEDGAAAWESLQKKKYDLLVTDNSMCRLTGIGLVKKLRAARMALPVIMVSGAMPTNELERHPWLRINAALLKPFTIDELVGTVKAVLRASKDVCDQSPTPPPDHNQRSAGGLQF